MELGTYQGWQQSYEDEGIYDDLGITWFGPGFSARAGTEEAIGQIVAIEETMKHGKVWVKWVCDSVRVKEETFFKECEEDFKWMAENIPARRFEIYPEPTCPLMLQRELLEADYFEILRIAYETMKSVDPKIQVWNGGIGFFRTIWFLGDFFEQGLPLTDALNLHPFMFGDSWGQIAARISNLVLEAAWSMELMHQVKDIVVTEWSAPTEWRDQTQYMSYVEKGGVPALTEQAQAEVYIEVLEQFKAIGCPLFCFAAIKDDPSNTTHWSGHGGFFSPDGNKKLSYDAVKEWAKAESTGPLYIKEAKKAWK